AEWTLEHDHTEGVVTTDRDTAWLDNKVYVYVYDPESLAQTLQNIEEKLEEEKRKSLESEEAQLNLCEATLESFNISDTLNVNRNKNKLFESLITTETLLSVVQNSGTFKVDEAKVGFADVG
ncbi:MAG: hypothetical protein QXW83_04075, partial [Nitrososphaerales archaeon]